jgi:VanZ family protein
MRQTLARLRERSKLLTHNWRQAMVPGRTKRFIQLTVLVILMAALSWWFVFSWVYAGQVRAWEKAIELWWSPEGTVTWWWQNGDVPFHVFTTFILACIVGLGRRLVCPGASLWAVIGVVVVIALGDETVQAFVPGRTFDPGDLGSDALGLALALGLLIFLRDRGAGGESDG